MSYLSILLLQAPPGSGEVLPDVQRQKALGGFAWVNKQQASHADRGVPILGDAQKPRGSSPEQPF